MSVFALNFGCARLDEHCSLAVFLSALSFPTYAYNPLTLMALGPPIYSYLVSLLPLSRLFLVESWRKPISCLPPAIATNGSPGKHVLSGLNVLIAVVVIRTTK